MKPVERSLLGMLLGFLGLLLVVAVVAGCGDRSREDAGDLTKTCRGAADRDCIDKSPKRVIANHNGFPNISTGCDGYGHRYYVTTRRQGNQVVVIDDPSCPGGATK